jgi:hypothetical protein
LWFNWCKFSSNIFSKGSSIFDAFLYIKVGKIKASNHSVHNLQIMNSNWFFSIINKMKLLVQIIEYWT